MPAGGFTDARRMLAVEAYHATVLCCDLLSIRHLLHYLFLPCLDGVR
jgi:hypothetical protein